MAESWIDEHTGDELIPAAGAQDRIRTQLLAEWEAPASASRRRVWWAGAAVLVLGAGGVVVLAARDTDRRIGSAPEPPATEATVDASEPAATTAAPVAPTTTSAGVDNDGDGEIVEALASGPWVFTGEVRAGERAWFVLGADGSVRGSDGCNTYAGPATSADEAARPWRVDGGVVIGPGPAMESTTALCVDDASVPLAPITPFERTATLLGDGRVRFVDADGAVAEAVRLDRSNALDAAETVGRWASASVDVELSVDGTLVLSGADGATCTGSIAAGAGAGEVVVSLGPCPGSGSVQVVADAMRAAVSWHAVDGALALWSGERVFSLEPADEPSAPAAAIVVPASDGEVVSPAVFARIPTGAGVFEIAHTTGEFGFAIALVPDGVIVFETLPDVGFTGRALGMDRAGSSQRMLRVDPVLAGPTAMHLVAGGDDGSVYVVTAPVPPDGPPTQEIARRLVLDGDRLVVVDTVPLDPSGDAELRVTADGLRYADGPVVIAAPDETGPAPSVALVDPSGGDPTGHLDTEVRVRRTDPDGSSVEWLVQRTFDGAPPYDVPLLEPFGGGAIYSAFTARPMSSPTHGAFLAILQPDGSGVAYRFGPWQLVDHDAGTLLFARATETGLELASITTAG